MTVFLNENIWLVKWMFICVSCSYICTYSIWLSYQQKRHKCTWIYNEVAISFVSLQIIGEQLSDMDNEWLIHTCTTSWRFIAWRRYLEIRASSTGARPTVVCGRLTGHKYSFSSRVDGFFCFLASWYTTLKKHWLWSN